MFKRGNLLKRKIDGSIWLVDTAEAVETKTSMVTFKMRLRAICIFGGHSWKRKAYTGHRTEYIPSPGMSDTWFFREEDGSDKEELWELVNEV